MSYKPSIAIHPGRAIARELDFLGMSQKWLAERTGLSEKHISQIINGEASITADTAILLENAIGGSASYWANLDSNYRATLATIEQKERAESEIGVLKEESYKTVYNELAKLDRVAKTQDLAERVINFWKFFGVNSMNSIKTTEAVAFRRSNGKNINPIALAAWLRCGEIDSKKVSVAEFDEQKLKQIIPIIRRLTYDMPKDFYKQLVKLLADCGVALVSSEHLKGTYAHGATRWIGQNPVIQLSLRGKDADKMWFTLFHEIGHILKHNKKTEYINYDSKDNTPYELEADHFAAETLLPTATYNRFKFRGAFSESAIKELAAQEQISAGIIVGRLKHDGILPFQALQHLHSKLEFSN